MSIKQGIILISLLMLFVAIILAIFNLSAPYYHLKKMNSEQNEIILTEKNSTNVLTNEGKLTMTGWSRFYNNFKFNPDKINPSTSYLTIFNKLRYKKWEAFVFVHKDFILETAIFDLSHVGGYMFNYGDLNVHNEEIFADQNLYLFNKPKIADVCHQNCVIAEYKIDFLNYNQTKGPYMSNQHLAINYVKNNLNITLDLDLYAKDYESMVTLTPINEDSTLFYYNIKTYTIKAKGSIIINGKKYDADDLLLTNDSGRGVWPLYSGWIWASANGKTNTNEDIGLNFGHGFNHPDSSRHTEDSFFINGKVFKLAAVDSKKINPDNEMSEWTFISEYSDQILNRCNIIFRPKKNIPNVNPSFAPSKFNVKYGIFSGKCYDSDGKVHEFSIWGILENKISLW